MFVRFVAGKLLPPPDAKNSHIGIRHSQPGVAAKVGDVSDAGKPVQ